MSAAVLVITPLEPGSRTGAAGTSSPVPSKPSGPGSVKGVNPGVKMPVAIAYILDHVKCDLAGLARRENALQGFACLLAGHAVELHRGCIADSHGKCGQNRQQTNHQHHDGNEGLEQGHALLPAVCRCRALLCFICLILTAESIAEFLRC